MKEFLSIEFILICFLNLNHRSFGTFYLRFKLRFESSIISVVSVLRSKIFYSAIGLLGEIVGLGNENLYWIAIIIHIAKTDSNQAVNCIYHLIYNILFNCGDLMYSIFVPFNHFFRYSMTFHNWVISINLQKKNVVYMKSEEGNDIKWMNFPLSSNLFKNLEKILESNKNN